MTASPKVAAGRDDRTTRARGSPLAAIDARELCLDGGSDVPDPGARSSRSPAAAAMCSPGIRTASTSASCSDAATICRQTGDWHGEGAALTSLGNALERVRRFDEATTAYQGAAAIFHQTGDEYSERIVLDNLGKARAAQ